MCDHSELEKQIKELQERLDSLPVPVAPVDYQDQIDAINSKLNTPIEMQILDGEEVFSQKRTIGGKPFKIRVEGLIDARQ